MVTENKNGHDNEQNQEAKSPATVSQKFISKVEEKFKALMGEEMKWSDYQKRLAQNLFLKADASLKELEAKRDPNKQKVAITWQNVNMQKLALDAVHRIALGLDALVPNHIHTIPYFNNSTKKYDVNLLIGYKGKDYYKRQSAVEQPLNVIYELVYSNDKFRPLKKGNGRNIESYEFEIAENPFQRGEVIGGFGYVEFEDPRKNYLVIVSENDFGKAKKSAKSSHFWDNYPEEMRYKTLVHRVTETLSVDPRKVNTKSYAYVEAQEEEEAVQREVNENASTEVIDIDYNEVSVEEEQTGEQTGEIPEGEQQETEEKETAAQGTINEDGPAF